MHYRIQFIIILLVFILFYFPHETHGYGDFERARRAVVKIVTNGENKIGTGSIIKVENGKVFVLTAWHVVSNEGVIANDIGVYFFRNPRRFPAKVWERSVDVHNDLAYLIVENAPQDLPTISIGNAKKFEGRDEVFVISHLIDGTDWNFIMTRVINKYGADFIVLSYGAIDSGSSGAPMFNKEAEMIAMIRDVKRLSGTNPTLAYALVAEVITTSIRELPLGPLPPTRLPPRRKRGWLLLSTGVTSGVVTAFGYHYYREAQHNWEKAKTPEESDKYDKQKKVRGLFTALPATATVAASGIGLYLLLTEGKPPAAIFPEIGYNDVSGNEHFMLKISWLF